MADKTMSLWRFWVKDPGEQWTTSQYVPDTAAELPPHIKALLASHGFPDDSPYAIREIRLKLNNGVRHRWRRIGE